MEKYLVLALGEVIEQAGLRETVWLKVVPYLVAKVTLVEIDVKDSDDRARLVLLVGNLFVYLGDLEVIQNAIGKHVTDQHLVVE